MPTPTSVEVITSRSKVAMSVSALVPSVVVQAASAKVETMPKEARIVRVAAGRRRPLE
jgi:hypothetical protein